MAYAAGGFAVGHSADRRLGWAGGLPEASSINQGAEDLTGVAMLATTPTLRQAALAFENHFVGTVGAVADRTGRCWPLRRAAWSYWRSAARQALFSWRWHSVLT